LKKFLPVILSVCLIAGVAFSGCDPEEEEITPEEEVEEMPDELVVAMGAEPESLDPIGMESAPAASVSEHISQQLVYLADDGEIEPQLVEEWEVSDDDLTWTLELRDDVEFHDGTTFDAEAVQINLERFKAEDAPFSFLIEAISEIEVADEYTVELHLEEPFAPMLSHLSHSFIGMVSPESLDALEEGESIEKPVGTGPYKITEWDRGSSISVERNDNYWGEAPEIENITYKFVEESGSRIAMLETGEAHVTTHVPPAEAERLEGVPEIDVMEETSPRVIYIGFNVQKEPFDDPQVRQALNYAVDKQTLVDTILGGQADPSTAPVVPAVFGYHDAGTYDYDPEYAEELLADAGYEDGIEVTLHHPEGRYMEDAEIAEAVQSMLAEVDVDVSLETLEWTTYLELLDEEDPDASEHEMFMLGWGAVTLDADYGMYPLHHSAEWPPGQNYSYYENEELDGLLEEARVNPDEDARIDIYEDAIELIWDDAPWIFLHDEPQINAQRVEVEGINYHPVEVVECWDARFVE